MTSIAHLEEGVDPIFFFYSNPSALFELQKGFLPKKFLERIVSTETGLEAYIKGWTSYLLNLAKTPGWRLTGSNFDESDFVQSMMLGLIPSKEAIQSQGGIWQAVEGYNPTRDGVRPTVCPGCGSSFWSYEYGNMNKAFANWGIEEYRENRNECRPQLKVKINNKEKKVCGHILSGPYESLQAAEIAKGESNQVAFIEGGYYVVCGHPANLMSFNNYIHSYIMRPLRAENRRFLTAKTKGRTNVVDSYSCPVCSHVNKAQPLIENNITHYQCDSCGTKFTQDEIHIFQLERGSISIDAPLGEDGKSTVGDMLASRVFIDEDLATIQSQIQETRSAFTQLLDGIVDAKVQDVKKRYDERRLTKIPGIQRSIERAKRKNDKDKLAKHKEKLEIEQANLLRDLNKIEYTSNFVEMFKLHYIGDDEERKYDFRELTEMFMFKSLPYTLCQDCGNRDFELNETGKIESSQRAARQKLKDLAKNEAVEGYDKDYILNCPTTVLYPELGSYFYCTKCNSTHLRYFAPGSKNPEEPRIEITPHIFQPAQREIRELEAQVFSYKLLCSNCGTSNKVRPDKITGKVSNFKISKRVVEQDGKRLGIREETEHRCSKCNTVLTLDDIVEASNAKDAYSLLVKLRELVQKRNELQDSIRAEEAREDGWAIQSF